TLDVSGIIIIVTKAGMATSGRCQLIFLIPLAIKAPTIISAGAVTADVITESSGEKNRETANKAAIIIEVNPVLPPAAIPALDSTIAAVVDVPSTAPTVAADESASSARPALGILFSFIKPAWEAIAINEPAVSKKATNRNV